MAGHPGLSGQNAQLHVVWAPSREAGHVMRPATPVVVLLSRHAHVAWLNVTVEVRKYIIYINISVQTVVLIGHFIFFYLCFNTDSGM